MTKTQKVKFSAKCAESVLHIFEEKCTKDTRPRECLAYLREFDSFENLTDDQIKQIEKHWIAVSYIANDAIEAGVAAFEIVKSDRNATDNDDDAAGDAVITANIPYSNYAAEDAADYTIYAVADTDAMTARNASARKNQEKKCLDFVLDVLKENEK